MTGLPSHLRFVHLLIVLGLFLSGCPEISIDPPGGPQGAEQMVIEVTGTNTSFSQSETRVEFSRAGDPSGILVHYPLDVQSQTRMFVTISIPAGEPTGPQALVVTTEDYSPEASFEVLPQPSIGLDPGSIEQGDVAQVVTVDGTNTQFTDPNCLGAPVVTIQGVDVANWQYSSDTEATVEISVGLGVADGHYPDAFQIVCDYQTLSTGLTITKAVRHITIDPDSIEQGSRRSVTIDANKAEFTQLFDVSIIPPEGIDITWTPPALDTTAVIEVSVHGHAEFGARTMAVTDPHGTIETPFYVTEDLTPPSVYFYRDVVRPGDVVTVEARGTNTAFVDLGTVLEQQPVHSDLQLSIDSVPALDLALLSATVASQAEEREYTVTLTTDLERVENTIWVVPEPSMTLNTTEGHQGVSYTVHVNGMHTHFDQQDSELTAKAGSGLSVSNWTVTGPLNASFILHVADAADPQLVSEAITISTEVLGHWTETVTANFRVRPGIPEAELFPPAVDAGVQNVEIRAEGRFTSWATDHTSVTVDATCQDYLSVDNVDVTSETDLTFQVDVHFVAPPLHCGIEITTDSSSIHEQVRTYLDIQSVVTLIGRPLAQTINGTVDGPQLYSIELFKGEVLRARVSNDPVLYLDPTLELHFPGGNHLPGPVAQNEDEHAATDDALIVYHVPEDGTYYLVVQDRLGFEVGDFTLSLDNYHLVFSSDPIDSGQNVDASNLDDITGPVIRGEIDYAMNERWYSVLSSALPSASRTAVQVIARSVSPYETSTSDVLLRLLSSSGPLDSSNIGTESPDPVLYVDTSALDRIVIENDLNGLGSTTYWLNLRPWLVINEVYHDEVNDWEASFVELYGEPGVQMSGCSIIGRVDDGVGESIAFDISLDGSQILESGYYVVAHDDLVPGVGEPHINADLRIVNGPYVSVGVFLECNSTIIDAICWRGDSVAGCTEGAVPDATTIGNSLGRGYHVDTNDNLQDFLPQPEPSPWNQNLREVW